MVVRPTHIAGASPNDVAGSAQRWAWAVMCLLRRPGMPPTTPISRPILGRSRRARFPPWHCTLFTVTAAALCAGRETTWENLFLQRCRRTPGAGNAQHGGTDRQRTASWRAIPGLRLGTLEAGLVGCRLMALIDEHAQTVKAALPALAHKPSEYVLEAGIFQASNPLGYRLTILVIILLGEDLLM